MLHGSVNGPHDHDPTYNPNSNFSITANLRLIVNTAQVTIPAGIGSGIQTDAADGVIHIHPGPRSTFVTLGEFFSAWRNDVETPNPNAILTPTQLLNNTASSTHVVRMFVNGFDVDSYGEYRIHDQDDITLVYTANPIVVMNTNVGPIPVELFATPTSNSALFRAGQTAPVNTAATVDNFLFYVNSGEFTNMFFHRLDLVGPGVADDFVLQGGRLQTDGSRLPSGSVPVNASAVAKGPTITNQPGLSNLPGTIAMARLGDTAGINTATSEFFFNLKDNRFLDTDNQGFTVFGQVLDFNTIDAIRRLNTAAFSTTVVEALLRGASEVPPVTTSAEGGAALKVNETTGRFDLSIFVEGISRADLRESHIHLGTETVNGAAVFSLGNASQWIEERGGLRREITNAEFPLANLSSLVNGGTYINIKTNARPDGEIRGQLFRATTTNAPRTSDSRLVFVQSTEGEGIVRGVTFNDTDADGVRDAGEAGLANFTVFVDLDGDGTRDAEEPSTTTGTDGSYQLRAPNGRRTIREIPGTGFGPSFPVTGSREVTVQIGQESTGIDFGNLQLDAPSAPVLIAATDSGVLGDRITRFNNRSTASALRFEVAGVRAGATVRILADGQVIGQTVASGTTVTVTTNGVTRLANGIRQITATQTVGGATSSPSTALAVTVDTTVTITSTPPTTAASQQALLYNAQSGDEGQAGFRYTLGSSAPAGITLDTDDGELRWTPTTAQVGAHRFRINAFDAAGNSSFQELTISVGGVEGLANNDARSVAEDGAALLLDVLDNDVAQPGSSGVLTVTAISGITAVPAGSVTQPGTFELTSDNKNVRYTPAPNFFGQVRFTYNATDGTNTDSAVVTIDVTAANDAPAVVADRYNVNEDSINHIFNVIANDTVSPDAASERSELRITSISAISAGGTVQITSGGTRVRYTPLRNFSGTETFSYTISDRVTGGLTSTGTVTVVVRGANDPPNAVANTFTIDEDSAVQTFDVLANDTTPDTGETLTITSISGLSAGGTATIQSGTIRYTPLANFVGTETFTYTISDGNNRTDSATVTVTIRDVNDNPVATNDQASVLRAGTVTINVLSNDSFAPDTGETLTVTAVSTATAGGTITISTDRKTVTYTNPSTTFSGNDTFTYTLSDGRGGTAQGTVTVQVLGFAARAIRGTVTNGSPGRTLGGLSMRLTGTDSNGAAVNRTVATGANGIYAIPDLGPGNYTVTKGETYFLAPLSSATRSFESRQNDGDSTGNDFLHGGRKAEFMRLSDFLGSAPRESLTASVVPGGAQDWYSLDGGWSGLSSANVQLSADLRTITLTITETSGAQLRTTIDANNRRLVDFMAQTAGHRLLRILGGRSAFTFQTVPAVTATSTATGEGEARSLRRAEGEAGRLHTAAVAELASPSTGSPVAALELFDPLLVTAQGLAFGSSAPADAAGTADRVSPPNATAPFSETAVASVLAHPDELLDDARDSVIDDSWLDAGQNEDKRLAAIDAVLRELPG